MGLCTSSSAKDVLKSSDDQPTALVPVDTVAETVVVKTEEEITKSLQNTVSRLKNILINPFETYIHASR